MRRVSIIAIMLALFAVSPLYAVRAGDHVCASGQSCPWQNKMPVPATVHAAGHLDLNCAFGSSAPCCQYRPGHTKPPATALVLSVPSFREAPAVAATFELPRGRMPAEALYIHRMVSKEIPLFLKNLSLLC